MKAPFCPVFLLKLTPGHVVKDCVKHLGFMHNTNISVAPVHSYSGYEKYHRFYIEVLLAELRLFPSLRAPWTVHGVTGQDTRQNFVTELHARDMQGRVR